MNKAARKLISAFTGMKTLGKLMVKSFQELQKNDPLRMAGATAFFTTFALPPILIILIRLFGLFIDSRKFVSELFNRLSSILDASSVLQVKQTLRNIRAIKQEGYIALFGFIFFLFVASTLFNVIKNSLDQIWKIGMKDHPGILYNLGTRVKSISIIVLAGILFFIGLLTEGIRALFGDYVQQNWPLAGKLLNGTVNEVFFALTVTVWFTVLFRYLTNGRPRWNLCFFGGFLTAVLFSLGKYIVRYMLALSNIGTVYGSSGSTILIMLFVFYSSLIFYFGACFIKIISDYRRQPIGLVKGAYKYRLQEVI